MIDAEAPAGPGGLATPATTALAGLLEERDPRAKAEGRVPGVAVVVAQVTARDVPVRVRAIGNVQASATVSVLAQIGGEITKIHFKEGQDVETGDLLFTIDPRTFEAALQQARAQLAQHQAQITQAEANLARDKAQHDNAVVEEDRYRRLVDSGMIAREQYDQIRTNELSLAATIKADQAAVETARAVVRADEAAVENMRLQLAYTEIRAPFDGRTGNAPDPPGQCREGQRRRQSAGRDQPHPPDLRHLRGAGAGARARSSATGRSAPSGSRRCRPGPSRVRCAATCPSSTMRWTPPPG